VNRRRSVCVLLNTGIGTGSHRLAGAEPGCGATKETSVFEQIMGLPLHPLLVHAAVVFVPLLALGAIAYAAVPRLRQRIRWAVVLLAIAGPGAAFVAERSGDAFRARLVAKNLASAEILAKVDQHESYGTVAMLLAVALGVVTLIMTYVVRPVPGRVDDRVAEDSSDGAPSGARRHVSSPPLVVQIVLGAVAIGLAVAAVFYVYRTGDSGARIVWNGF
jgi:hypothetical protein